MLLRWLFWLVLFPIRLPFLTLRAVGARLRPCVALELRLHGTLPDVAAASGPFSPRQTPLISLLAALSLAEKDPKLRRVVVVIDEFTEGLGRAEELRAALSRVREGGKEVVVLADHLNLVGYWVAMGASRIVLAPSGTLDVVGIASQFTLLKGLLDKVGVSARLLAKGRYKSMREMFAEDEISDANREMLTALVDDLYRQLSQRLCDRTGLDAEGVRALVDRGPFRASEARDASLVDELAYPYDLRAEWLREKRGRRLSALRYLRYRRRSWLPNTAKKVAVLEVEGSIRMGKDNYGPNSKRGTGATSFLQAVERVEQDDDIAAILLRVNSPGGSALASDLMWHALGRARKERPLFVSMGNVAASGGYYVSGIKGARIFASPTTITGSIGVVGGKFEVTRLLDRLGITQELIAIGKNADFYQPTRDWTEEQLQQMQRDIDSHYEDFVAKMADGRGLSRDALHEVAQGRVWTGAMAQERRLVDELGGLNDALAALRRELGVAEDAPLECVVVDRPTFWKRVSSRFENHASSSFAPAEALGGALSLLVEAQALRGERVWARLPFDIELF